MVCTNCQYENVKSAEHCASCGIQLDDGFIDALDPQLYKQQDGLKANVKYAGFWIRFAAYVIDSVIGSFVMGVVGAFVGAIIGFMLGAMGVDVDVIQGISGLFGAFLGFIFGWLYFALQESSEKQATIGKRVVGIKVTDIDGGRLTFGRATGRHFAKMISGLTFMIGYIMAGFDDRKQALHDKFAKTFVIHK